MPSIGSTTSTHSASPGGRDHAAVLGVEGDARGALGEELLHPRLGALVDREGDVAALGLAGVVAARRGRRARGSTSSRSAAARSMQSCADQGLAATRSGRGSSSTSISLVLAVAEDLERHGLARPLARDQLGQVALALQLGAVDGDDHVAARLDLRALELAAGRPSPRRPASSAGPSSTTSEIRAPVSAPMPSSSASCGQMPWVETPR